MPTLQQYQEDTLKKFDERYDHYNPINDTGVGIPPWNGADYQDIKSFISESLKGQLEVVVKEIQGKLLKIEDSAFLNENKESVVYSTQINRLMGEIDDLTTPLLEEIKRIKQ